MPAPSVDFRPATIAGHRYSDARVESSRSRLRLERVNVEPEGLDIEQRDSAKRDASPLSCAKAPGRGAGPLRIVGPGRAAAQPAESGSRRA